ncbi:unnamed protein product [Blepharisma stoltei]|uniref:Cyclin-like domain-containing protein n=1 Tax=Blepharisma stoltei TaxID=1481888 RepID=A0AAU9ISE6_9CILI|nr:unnamed protein product [Blepharisma stoltei]
MSLAELDVNIDLSLPRKRVHLDLYCSETIDIQDSVTGFKPSDTDTLKLLQEREASFGINPFYFETIQTEITPSMRLMLADWMIKAAHDFSLNRETFQIALSIVDKTLSNFKVSKGTFQLLGIASLIISSKLEELHPPTISDFVLYVGAFSQKEIYSMEKRILKNLGWRILPATLNHWCNWLMAQWDDFVVHTIKEFDIRFKRADKKSYRLYREVIGILDGAILDSSHLNHSQPKLVAACIYLVLQREICTGEHSASFEKHFEYWLGATLEVASTVSLLKAKEYLQQFLGLPIGYDLPKIYEDFPRDSIAKSYEDFLGFQIHNSEIMPFIKAIIRNNR